MEFKVREYGTKITKDDVGTGILAKARRKVIKKLEAEEHIIMFGIIDGLIGLELKYEDDEGFKIYVMDRNLFVEALNIHGEI